MALNQRRVKILDLIREDGHAKVQELSRIFNVTDVTIRQDLEALEKLGYIQREHGGAFLKDVGSFAKTGKVFNQTHIEEKREIAQKAASFISEGECIILDSGSTTTEIAKLLTQYKELTVITNALNIALILGENPGINLIVTGGEFKAPTLSLTGKMAARRRANRKWIALALVTVVLLSVMTWIGGNSLAEQNAQNLAQQQLLEEKIAEEEARSKELDEYSEYMKTDEFAEWYAKEKLGLIHKNEIIFKGE